jgi:hypothetical protein
MSKRQKNKIIKAARRLANGNYGAQFSCNALRLAEVSPKICWEYKQFYGNPPERSCKGWYGSTLKPQNQLARSIALLLFVEAGME